MVLLPLTSTGRKRSAVPDRALDPDREYEFVVDGLLDAYGRPMPARTARVFMMREVLERRLRAGLEKNDLPDLLAERLSRLRCETTPAA